MLFEQIEKAVTPCLKKTGYSFKESKETGLVYLNQKKSVCLKVDINICERSNYPYVSYTSVQNELVHNYKLFLRFSVNSLDDLNRLEREIEFFTTAEPEAEKLKQYGKNREEQEIDPTLPEATFEECFSLAFGEKSLYALSRESIYYDYDGKRRYIDYVLRTSDRLFAIELNGEKFHHPAAIKERRYQSQLFKQNSLSAEGYKVFRWSQRGMADREKFIQELKYYFGDPESFESTPHFKSLRSLQTFRLAEHQDNALNYIDSLRLQGRNTFIIVLPTATGKTEIFIEDIYRQYNKKSALKFLIMVPRKNLKQQTIDRFTLRYKELHIDENLFSADKRHICVQTYAYLLRHYHEVASDKFDYIVVDEAHHAQANGLKKILEYYTPSTLLGLTATDERLDQKRLEDIFGQYETQMTLKEAMQQGLVSPVSVYRLETNIDLTQVRFNGKDFVKSDLQKTIQIRSRDELIVRLMKEHFSKPLLDGSALKQGLIFCVDIKHARRIAQLFIEEGMNAEAVSGSERKQSDQALAKYDKGEIQFLCACDLLNEGWDTPQTSILVMARPTLSKVLYMQQLGRGMRHYYDKERLYVIDVVDSYGAQLQPWSTHGVLNIENYIPFGDLLGEKDTTSCKELHILSGLYEQVVRFVPMNLFTMQENLADMLSTEQLARELFVSTGTVKKWLKNKDIKADVDLPFGKNRLYFFSEENINNIRKLKNLSRHTEDSRRDDFLHFIREGDYTFSYKIIFLCLMFKLANERGEVDTEQLTKLYAGFYSELIKKHQKSDREKSPLNKIDFLENKNYIQKSILQNPFEKFERKRFMHHCQDLKYISFDSVLWRSFTNKDKLEVQHKMFDDLNNYYQQLNIYIDDQLRMRLNFIDDSDAKETSGLVIIENNQKETNGQYIPFYPIEIAAGGFSESEIVEQTTQWVDMRNITYERTLTDDLFISQIHGHSMEPTIPDGSYCLFKYGVVGSRTNRIVLAKKDGIFDNEMQTSFTIKRYFSEKIAALDSEWMHEKIELRPDNQDYETLEIKGEDADSFFIVAEFIQLLDIDV